MSESSEDSPKRILTIAQRIKVSAAKSKKESGDKSYERKQLKIYTSLCQAFDVSPKEFKDHWYSLENPGKDISATLQEVYGNVGLGRVRIYPGQLQTVSTLLSPKIQEHALWKFFIKAFQECSGIPIVPFRVKGVTDPFIMTNDAGTGNIQTEVLWPRVRIPVGGQSNDIYIYSLDLYKKENIL